MNVQDIEESNLPGAELVSKGLRDLPQNQLSVEALLVLIASPRLQKLGISIPSFELVGRPFEHALYALLQTTHGRGAHSQYNSLIRRIVSFSRALEREMGARIRSGGPPP